MKYKELILEARNVLMDLVDILNQLSVDEYIQKIDLMSNSSIGEHTRHIIELFQQLFEGYHTGLVDYDNRKRNINIQQNLDYAIETIAIVISQLDKTNQSLNITSLYNQSGEPIETNYYRELMYNIEHCVHHQALIKVALLYLEKKNISDHFGVAKSTISYRLSNVHS